MSDELPRRRLRLGCSWWLVAALCFGALSLTLVLGTVIPATIEESGSLTVSTPIEELFEALMDDAANPMGGDAITSVRRLDTGGERPTWLELRNGGNLRVRTLRVRRPDYLVRRIEDSSVPLTSDWTVELERVDEGTRVDYSIRTMVGPGGWQTFRFRLTGGPGEGTRQQVEAWIRHAAEES